MLRPFQPFAPPAALAFLLAVSACSDPSGGPAGDPLATAAGACARVRADMARVLVQCQGFTADVASDFLAALPELDCAAWTAAVGAGNTTYDPAMARVCLAVFDTITCNQYTWASQPGRSVFPYECSEALAGTLAPSAECTLDFECQSGACEFPPACDGPGTCAAAAPGENETCAAADPRCASGLVCDTGTCVRPPPIPAPVAVGGDCTDAPCVDAAFCRTSDSRCVARPTDGMSCSSAIPCAYRYRCTGTVGSQTCQPIRAAGGPCSFGDNDCEFGAYCVTASSGIAAGTCQAWSHAGGLCGLIFGVNADGGLGLELAGCSGSWCDVPDLAIVGTCEPYLAAGAVCTDAQECGPGSDCLDDGAGTLRCTELYCNP